MKRKTWIITSLVFVCMIAIFVYGYFSYRDVLVDGGTFKNGIKINGIDVSGLDKNQAQNVVATKLTDSRNNINITLSYKDKVWNWKGSDFEIDNQIMPYVENVFNYYNSGSIFERKYKLNKLDNGNDFNIPYGQVLTGLAEKVSLLAQEIDTSAVDAKVVFDASKQEPLSFSQEQKGEIVDQQKLLQLIDNSLQESSTVKLQVPTIIVEPQILKEDLQKTVAKRGSFSTSYKNSNADRKHNVKTALQSFNGMIIAPDQEVSFNQTTGARTEENGYKKANIILNGVYVEGMGGGVCQASTTLYNALLNADLQILEVNKHTLPASYVWLAFDAMVSEGYSDLRFKNNTTNNIYIRTYSTDTDVFVDIYGMPFPENEKVVRRVEFLGAIPHPGDRIVKDTTGQYSNKVTYKGEYLRLKYPREGYRAKAYLDRYLNDVLVDSVLIRDETYQAQEGIIIEGIEDLTEGLSLPKNTVKFIQPQEKSVINEENIQKKLEKENPSNYNP